MAKLSSITPLDLEKRYWFLYANKITPADSVESKVHMFSEEMIQIRITVVNFALIMPPNFVKIEKNCQNMVKIFLDELEFLKTYCGSVVFSVSF